jgi:aspartate/methionine/tyrosine aminotransferase
VPGSFLAATPSGEANPGAGHIRLALVADAATTAEALDRLAPVFEKGAVVPRRPAA